MDKATELIQPTEDRLKLSRLPSSSFSIENLIATEHRRHGGSPPGADRSPPRLDPTNATGSYLANAAGYNAAAMLSFTHFPLYNPWVGYLSPAANEKLSQLFSGAASGGVGGDKRVHKSVPGDPIDGSGSDDGPDQSDKSSIEVNAFKTFPGVTGPQQGGVAAVPNLEVAAQYFANNVRRSTFYNPTHFGESAPSDKINHSNYGGGANSAIGGRIFLRNFSSDLASPAAVVSRSSLDLQDSDSRQSYLNIDRDEDERPAVGDGAGDSNDDGSYSDDISLSLSPTGCGKGNGKHREWRWAVS